MKRIVVIVLLSLLCIHTYGKQIPDSFTFGAEWSYCATLLTGHRYYFIAPEGFRVSENKDKVTYCPDAEVYLHAGYDINTDWNLSIFAGYTGIGDFHTAIPISLRATRYFEANILGDKWFTYCDLGSGVSLNRNPSVLISVKAGGGYRLSLTNRTKLDFIASLRYMHTRPDVIFYGELIDSQNIGRNVGYIVSLSVGIGLTF